MSHKVASQNNFVNFSPQHATQRAVTLNHHRYDLGTSPKLAIITVVYENYTVLADFFDSLAKQTNQNYQIYVVDLSKHKETITHQKAIILHADNKGYAFGLNRGIQLALTEGYTFFACINSDTIVAPTFVDNAIDSIIKHPDSIIGGKIYYAKGEEYHKAKYKKHDLGRVLWYAGGVNDWKNVYTKHRGVDEVDSGQYDDFQTTDFVTGCLMCFDNKVVHAVGRMDESYFLYYEDADWCERAKRKGIKLYYDPSIVIWHKNAQSTGGSGSALHVRYQIKNRLKYGLKYAPLRTKLHLLKNYYFS